MTTVGEHITLGDKTLKRESLDDFKKVYNIKTNMNVYCITPVYDPNIEYLKQNIESVRKDVERGFVSVEDAKRLYGVIHADGIIDHDATCNLRYLRLAEKPKYSVFFDYGKGRTQFELVWTRRNYEVLTKILAAVPVHWRFFIKHRLFAEIGDEANESNHEKISMLFDEILEDFPQLKEAIEPGLSASVKR